ncbi:MAG: fluoride efflux transporter CrcB [Candidatus Avilachnospira sp.]|jgi:CrcB protein
MIECLFVGLGGFIGSVCRYLIGLIPVREEFFFPIKTFSINIIGAFIIGLISAFALKHPNSDPRLILLLKVGICGGFTTFSSFALESFDLIKGGHTFIAISYVILSILTGIGAVLAGEYIVNMNRIL